MAKGLTHIEQLLVESKTKEALEALQEWIRVHYIEKLDECTLQLTRYNMVTKQFGKGLLTLQEYMAEIMKINTGIRLLLVECMSANKESATTEERGEGSRPALNEYHSYTCDRTEHSDAFRAEFAKLSKQRKQFYYLFGGDMHSHEGFFRRVAYDLEGKLLDYLNPDLAASCVALQLEMTFEFSRKLDLYKQNILRSFFSMLGVPPNEHQPILSHDLNYAVANSPRLKSLSADDYVCVYLHISQYDWDKELTPGAARWFIREFCGGDLPVEWPHFLFFFAVEYDEEDQEISDEIKEALAQSEHLHVLPELNMVEKRDLARWLERYKQLAVNTRERKELLKTHFGQSNEHYMEDVELILKKIIDTYNSQL